MNLFGKLFSFVLGSADPLPDNAVLIDVRSPAEFASGHIRGALSLPLDRITRQVHGAVADQAAPIIVYCQSGARSASARSILISMGYSNVVNGGGIRPLASRLNREVTVG